MSSSFTRRLRLNKQGTGDNEDSWGVEQNVGAFDRTDDGWATVEVGVSGTTTLTIQQGLADQARSFVLLLTGTGGTLNTPGVDKPYFIDNGCSGPVTVTPQGGTGVVVRASSKVLYYTNAAGSVAYTFDPVLNSISPPTADVNFNGFKPINLGGPINFNGFKLQNVGTPAVSTDAANLQFVIDQITAAATINFPPVGGQASKVLTNDGTVLKWGGVQPIVAATNTALSAGITYRITSASPIVLTLPSSPAVGDTIGIIDGETITSSVSHTLARNGNTIEGLAENMSINVPGIEFSVWWSGSDWRLF